MKITMPHRRTPIVTAALALVIGLSQIAAVSASASPKKYTLAQTMSEYRIATRDTNARPVLVQTYTNDFWINDAGAGIPVSQIGNVATANLPTVQNPRFTPSIDVELKPTSQGWDATRVTQTIASVNGKMVWMTYLVTPICGAGWGQPAQGGGTLKCSSTAYPIEIYSTASSSYFSYPVSSPGHAACWNQASSWLKYTEFTSGTGVFTIVGKFFPMTKSGVTTANVASIYPVPGAITVHEVDTINTARNLFVSSRYVGIKAAKTVYSYRVNIAYPAHPAAPPAVTTHIC